MKKRAFVTIGSFCAVSFVAAWADAAEPVNAALADRLFREARAEMVAGNYESACVKLAESDRLDPGAGTLLNLSICEEHIGHIAEASSHASELLDRLAADDDRRPVAIKRAQALALRVPELTVRLVRGAPAQAVVSLDGVRLGRASLQRPVPLNPGRHVLRVTAPNHLDSQETIVLAEGQKTERVVKLGPATPPAATARVRGSAVVKSRESNSAVAWTLAGVGVAGLVGGAFLTRATLHKADELDRVCPDKQCPTRASLREGESVGREGQLLFASTVASFAFGAAGIALGGYLFTKPADSKPSERIIVGGAPGGGASVSWQRAF